MEKNFRKMRKNKSMSNQNWRIWEKNKDYGKALYSRAVKQNPEMESSKAAARIVADILSKNDLILDAGCGAGHYLVSLDKTLSLPFSYYGIDSTCYYIDLARQAFLSEKKSNTLRISTDFKKGDIFNLPLQNNFADIVMCNNVFLHLPSIEKALSELWRVTKKYVIVRTLIGSLSFRIKQIVQPEEYSEDGEPVNYCYFNIYSYAYIDSLIKSLGRVEESKLIKDTDFNPRNIGAVNYKGGIAKPRNMTSIVCGMQVNNYIIEPWHFLILKKGS